MMEEVTQLRQAGKSDQEIASYLKQQGYSDQDIQESLNQSKIKQAVNAEPSAPFPSIQEAGMEPSVMSSYPQQSDYQQQGYDYSQSSYPQAQQQSYDYSTSSDTITEIAEQVATEKISAFKDQLEKVIDFKTNIDSKIDYIDERVKRIEKMIDRLQISILQKVGDSLSSIDDIKKEIQETQKTFKAIHHHGK